MQPIRITPGELSRQQADVLTEALRAIHHLQYLESSRRTAGFRPRLHIPAKLTAVDANGDYTWVQVEFDGTGQAEPYELPGGLFGGPDHEPARERNGVTISTFPVYVELAFRSHTEDKGVVWEFSTTRVFSGFRTTTFAGTVASGATTTIVWATISPTDDEHYDTDGFQLSTTQIEIPAEGYYLVGANLRGQAQSGAGNAAEDVHLILRQLSSLGILKHVLAVQSSPLGAGHTYSNGVSLSSPIHLPVGDLIDVQLFNNTAGQYNWGDGNFWIHKIG